MFRHRMTVTSLAAAIRKGRASISLKVNGNARWYLDELVLVAGALDTTVGYLLGETDDDRRPAHMQKAPAMKGGGSEYAPRDLNPEPAD